jgi:hypothetical protein
MGHPAFVTGVAKTIVFSAFFFAHECSSRGTAQQGLGPFISMGTGRLTQLTLELLD